MIDDFMIITIFNLDSSTLPNLDVKHISFFCTNTNHLFSSTGSILEEGLRIHVSQFILHTKVQNSLKTDFLLT